MYEGIRLHATQHIGTLKFLLPYPTTVSSAGLPPPLSSRASLHSAPIPTQLSSILITRPCHLEIFFPGELSLHFRCPIDSFVSSPVKIFYSARQSSVSFTFMRNPTCVSPTSPPRTTVLVYTQLSLDLRVYFNVTQNSRHSLPVSHPLFTSVTFASKCPSSDNVDSRYLYFHTVHCIAL